MQRPIVINFFALLNVAFAVAGVVAVINTSSLLFRTNVANNPVVRVMQENPDYIRWLKIAMPIGIAACAVLLVAGIGLFRLKEWARRLSIGYAIYAIIFCAFNTVASYFLLFQPLMAEAGKHSGPESYGAIGGAVGAMIGGWVSLLHPILMIYFMVQPNVVAAFRPPAAPPPLPVQ